MYSSKKRLTILVFVLIFAILLIATVLYFLTSLHEGEYKVTLVALPDDAQLLVDDEGITGMEVWVEAGQHTFEAEKDGFDSDSVTRNITEDTTITLLPSPVSDEAVAWAKQPGLQAQIEELGGQRANERGDYISEQNPIIDKLPYVSISGPFKIDFGYYGPDNTKTYLIIHRSTPNGRLAALDWIRQQGYDPVQLDIRFSDFQSPLFGGEV